MEPQLLFSIKSLVLLALYRTIDHLRGMMTDRLKLRVLKFVDLFQVMWRHENVRNLLFQGSDGGSERSPISTSDVDYSMFPQHSFFQINQPPLMSFILDHRVSIEKRILSRYTFEYEQNLSGAGEDPGFGLIDLAAVQQSVLQLDPSLCSNIEILLKKRIAALELEEQNVSTAVS
uniref:Uncharacterized protein n=1 Tax=Spongospora subterranea TaxID=70186 RepID=A0A0H5QWI2_9EUKA|eukprot:CRZ06117.1 hypothetical protein [Spongospora subterranea]